jgi:hypothetical protein
LVRRGWGVNPISHSSYQVHERSPSELAEDLRRQRPKSLVMSEYDPFK